MKTDLISVNGELMPLEKYTIWATDRAFRYGDGVYTQVPVYAGKPLFAGDFMDQLMDDCIKLRIPMVLTVEELCQFLQEFLEAAEVGRENCQIYVQVTRGMGGDGLNAPETNIPELSMQLLPWSRKELVALRETGAKLHTVTDKRGEMCDIHTTCRVGEVLARAEARRGRLYDALFVLADGKVTEATEAAFYVVKDGLLWTHPLDGHVHPSLHARLLKEKLAPELNLTVLEKPFTVDFALSAEEAFLLGGTVEFLPVVKLARKLVADGQPGQTTRNLQDAYEEFVTKHLKL